MKFSTEVLVLVLVLSCACGGLESEDAGSSESPARTSELRPRVLLLRPSYLMVDSLGEIDNQTSILEQWGIPYDVAEPITDLDAQLEQLSGHTLAVFPGYLVPEVLNERRLAKLRTFVEQGGVLIVVKPVFDDAAAGLGELLGIRASERRFDLERLEFGRNAAATRLFDSPEERSVPLLAADDEAPPEAYLLLGASPETRELAHGYVGAQRIGAVVTRRALGRGAVYTLGHNLHEFRHARCYINCFEPSGDLAGLFLREALRESAAGHVAWLHTVPGPEDSLLLLTHDVDADDAYEADPAWGEPGALRVAELERRAGARGSFLITTDYVAGYYAPEVVRGLCDLGMCPVGSHSVTHGDIRSLPRGDCTETFADYPETRSLCGEVRIPLELAERDGGERPVAWRSPFLYVADQLYDVLESQGIGIDSSYAVGDLKFNLPISLARTGVKQHMFHHKNLYTLSIALEDGMGHVVDGQLTREELSEGNRAEFTSRWRHTVLRNADNFAYTVALLHPSYGHGVPQDNLDNKLRVLKDVIRAAKARGVKVDATLADVLEFWRAREGTRLDVYYASGVYRGALRVGAHPMKNLTLEFGAELASFECASCGETRVIGKRVVLKQTLTAESEHAFQAR